MPRDELSTQISRRLPILLITAARPDPVAIYDVVGRVTVAPENHRPRDSFVSFFARVYRY